MTMIPLVIGANIQRYGARWIVDTLNYMTGATPAETRAQDEKLMRFIRGVRDWFKPDSSRRERYGR